MPDERSLKTFFTNNNLNTAEQQLLLDGSFDDYGAFRQTRVSQSIMVGDSSALSDALA